MRPGFGLEIVGIGEFGIGFGSGRLDRMGLVYCSVRARCLLLEVEVVEVGRVVEMGVGVEVGTGVVVAVAAAVG